MNQRASVHSTELPEAPGDSPMSRDWNCFRREVGRLLAEGHEGKFVPIKDQQVVGLYGSWEDASWIRKNSAARQAEFLRIQLRPVLEDWLLDGPAGLFTMD